MAEEPDVPYDVKLPDIGEGIAEGEIVRWLVKLGDSVREDQPLVEVMTDKASVEIPSPRTGVIAALCAEEGQVVPVGSVIISIAVAGETAGSAAGAAPVTVAAATPGPAPAKPAAATAPGRVEASPAVRQLAKQLGVPLERLAGTGPGGAITADDVKRAAGGAAVAAAGPALPAAAPASSDEERVPLRGLRRKIAEHMRHSLSTAAQFTFVAECDFTAVVAHRAGLKARAEAARVRLTFLPYVVRALVEPLRQFPLLNSSLDDARHEIVLRKALHIGIATATADGLTVPVLHDADRSSLFALARDIERLSAAARDHKLKLEELQGATFTITSTGARGGVLATPILHHPQVAILGVHEVKPRPAVVNGAIVIRDLGNLSLSLDHRVVDGAVGADFLYALIARLEHPEAWLTEGDLV
jgi:pyruvate dehydrogenase E2 component (dihydrolipoamide acetyltransferase)